MVEVASSNIKGSNLPFDHNITFWMILAGVVLIASLALRFVVSYLKVLKGNRVLALEAILLLIGGVLLRFFVVFVLQI